MNETIRSHPLTVAEIRACCVVLLSSAKGNIAFAIDNIDRLSHAQIAAVVDAASVASTAASTILRETIASCAICRATCCSRASKPQDS